MKKSILFVAYDFPPILSPESIQVQRRALTLARNGHRVHVLTCCEEPDFEFIDKDLSRDHDNLTIHRVNKLPAEKWLHYLCGILKITDRKLWWKFPATGVAQKIIKEFDIDTFYTHSNPLVNHFVGLSIKESNPKLRWIAHFSDPWTLTAYSTYPTSLQKKINQYYEKQMVKRADTVTVTSHKTKDLFIKGLDADGNKIKVLPHVYDPDLYTRRKKKPPKKIVAHTGNIYGLRTVAPLIDAIDKVQPENLEFHFYGRMKDEERKLAERKCPGMIKIFDPVPYLQSIEVLSEADMLMVIDAPLKDSPFFPSKLADYIGAGKPVVALTPLSSTTTEIVRDIQKDLLVADSADIPSIAALIRRMDNVDSSILIEEGKNFYNMNNNYEIIREALINE